MFHSTETIHISSLVVHCLPQNLKTVMKATAEIENAEVAAHDVSGKLVVLLETKTEKEILAIIDHINTLAGVLVTSMVYHQLDC
ncbi:Periplasmic nitrate reductase component NapD [hydrothermal vent metagenome]|uniref:Periplasmic nitrate reductase component NapD n=1 Tax=hydrothermal vent metagenome TaxID=652676 RepID=A0A3B1A2H0_9ZZZZ